MNLAFVIAEKRGQTDKLLSEFAEHCADKGVITAGVVQTNTECTDSNLCDMDVRVLPDGSVFRISQSLGKEARGCRLDPEVLEHAVAEAQAKMSDETQLLIVNKFGKHEAGGRGFRDVIGHAVANDIPVLIGVNQLNRDAFLEFVGGSADHLESTVDALDKWFRSSRKNRQNAA